MPLDAFATNSPVIAAYRQRTPGSAALAAEARELFPSGVTHDARYLEPYGIYVTHAQGAHKWDVDGNRYIDYFGGHGALLLGHNQPKVRAATHEALARGTHFAANHEAEVRWAQAVRRLVPSAERVRFTSSGTEATLMCLRLARAATGRSRIVRFKGHFHGWHDDMTSGYQSHFDGSATPGVPGAVAGGAVLLEQGDVDAVRAAFEREPDIAAVILEPLGAGTGMVPLRREFLSGLRELCSRHGVVLIFDEVITGFRVAPGGVQAHAAVTPDLTALAKIVAGGLPGGAVAGRKTLLDALDHRVAADSGREKIYHPGTFNANPLSAAAGAAALEVVGETDACARANALGARLRERLNAVLDSEGVRWAVYGAFSAFHVFLNPRRRDLRPGDFDPFKLGREELWSKPPELVRKLRLAMLVNGVDLAGWPGGLVSAAHSEADIEATAEAFRAAFEMLRREGEI